MDRVFLDANVLYSAAYRPAGKMKRLWQLATAGKLQLVSSVYAVEEARRNLTTAAEFGRLEKILRPVEIGGLPPAKSSSVDIAALPVKDRPIMQAAIAMGATHLVSGNVRHFRSLYGKRVEGVLVLTPAGYLSLR